MKKISIVLAIMMTLSFSTLCSCTNTTQTPTPTVTPDAPTQQATADPMRPPNPPGLGTGCFLPSIRTGNTLNENGYAYSDIKDALYSKLIDGVYYYGLP